MTRYVTEVRGAMDWNRPPTIHLPSVSYFVRHLADLDPRRVHEFRLGDSKLSVDIPTLGQRAPEFAGVFLHTQGKLLQLSQVTVYPQSQSWALILRDPDFPEVLAVCRVPLRPGDEEGFAQGDTVHAHGVVLADGAAQRLDGKGSFRVVYLACASIARRAALFEFGPDSQTEG